MLEFLGCRALVPGPQSLGVVAAFAVATLFSSCRGPDSGRGHDAETNSPNLVAEIVAIEELIIDLGPLLNSLATAMAAEWSPAFAIEGLFAKEMAFRGITEEVRDSAKSLDGLPASIAVWGVEEADRMIPADQFSLWEDSRGPGGGRIERAEFSIVRGEFVSSDQKRFDTTVAFHGLVHAVGEQLIAVDSKQEVSWTNAGSSDWRITAWRTKDFRFTRSLGALFSEVLEEVLKDPEDLKRARHSRHRTLLLENYFGQKPASLPAGYSDSRFFPDSLNAHPALSVVDIDGDGWEDLYVCVRWGKNLLLRNRGDGTFEEVAARYGLAIEGRSTSASFADFDNDGDPDLILGRSLEQSLYLENVDGWFLAQPQAVEGPGFPWLVTSTSVADYNGDGLLDVFFCTYSPLDIGSRLEGRSADSMPQWATQFLSPDEAKEVERRMRSSHRILSQTGPPNVLFVNRGNGRFEVAPESPVLAGWRNSFQAGWSDFDQDGDPDLYVANDYAPDEFYRNNGGEGFEDITVAAGFDKLGFGMGVSWADYDNDGRDDLYVSNMFSKAGRRITGQVPELDERFGASAAGNYLYRNGNDTGFEAVSDEGGTLTAAGRAGWSWGGHFTDFDNDGFVDLYVANGFYTPPEEHALEVDL